MAKKTKMVSPQKANSKNYYNLSSLRTDSDEWSMTLYPDSIMLTRTGVSVNIPKRDLNKLIKWYQTEQKLLP